MPQLDPQDARQGKSGRPVLMVLIAGLVLAIIAFVGMGFFGASQPDENIGGAEESGISTEGAAPASGSGGATVVDPATTPPSPPSAPAN